MTSVDITEPTLPSSAPAPAAGDGTHDVALGDDALDLAAVA